MNLFVPDYHFLAIGGIGQSALAKILLDKGLKVSGSDISKSKYVNKLEQMGAKVYIGHCESNLQGSPVVVVSSAIKEDNPELLKAKELGLDIIHRSDLLSQISLEYPMFIGYLGTHGKTTTSSMAAYVLSIANYSPAYALGGILPHYNTNGYSNKNSTCFVAELDESDGSFTKFYPQISLINNLEAEHMDYYVNGLDDVLKEFEIYVNNLSADSKVLINIDDKANRELIARCYNYNNFISYAIDNQNATYQARNIVFDGLNSSFDVFNKDKNIGRIELSVPGKFNIINALGVCATLLEAGFSFDRFAQHFKTFSGAKRRFERVASFNDIDIVDDYGHHPSEITATLESVRNMDKRIVAIFQPHRYTRFTPLYEDFLKALSIADYIAVLDVYAAGESPISDKNSETFTVDLINSGKDASYFRGSIDQAGKNILPNLKSNDLVITFGAGDITRMGGVLNELYLQSR